MLVECNQIINKWIYNFSVYVNPNGLPCNLIYFIGTVTLEVWLDDELYICLVITIVPHSVNLLPGSELCWSPDEAREWTRSACRVQSNHQQNILVLVNPNGLKNKLLSERLANLKKEIHNLVFLHSSFRKGLSSRLHSKEKYDELKLCWLYFYSENQKDIHSVSFILLNVKSGPAYFDYFFFGND